MVGPPVTLPGNKRGPKRATAAQDNFLAGRAAMRPTVTPIAPAVKPNPFSASGAPSAPPASTAPGQSASGASAIPSPSTGAAANPQSTGMVPSASGQMKRGGPVKKYAAGGTTETNQYGSWGGANAANAAAGGAYTAPGAYSSLATPSSASGAFSTTPAPSPLTPATPSVPTNYTSALSGYKAGTGGAYALANSQMNPSSNGMSTQSAPMYDPTNLAQWDQLSQGQQAYIEYQNKDYGGYSTPANPGPKYVGMAARRGGSIPAFDDGGEVPDPGGAIPADPNDPGAMQDTGQGQAGQAGNLTSALDAVQQAYQYGMQQLSGASPQFMGGATQVQPSGPTVNGQPSWSEEDQANLDSTNNSLVGGVLANTGAGAMLRPGGTLPAKALNSAMQPTPASAQPMQARGGSVPSLADGGVMPPPAAPQPQQPTPAPAGGGVQGNIPPKIMRYLTGADAAPIPQVLRRQKSMDPKLPGTARTAHTIASAGGPAQQYAALQAFRRLSDAAGTHAKVALNGNGKIPASLPHAVMFANKKFEYAPSPLHVQFGLKGKKPQQAAQGGGIQAFDDGGGVDDPTQQISAAGAPSQAPASDSQNPITMTVQPLAGGEPQQFDINPDQLQTLVGTQYDKWLTDANSALHAAFASPTGELGGVGHGNARSLPDIVQKAQEQSEFSPGVGYPETPNTGKLQPENYYETGQQSNVAPGQQGGNGVRTFRPQDAEFAASKEFAGAPVGKVTSNALPPATEPINNTRDIPGTEIDKNGVRHVIDPEAYDDYRRGLTNFDFHTEPTEQGATPYSSQAGTPQTNLPTDETRGPDEPVNTIRAGMTPQQAKSNITPQIEANASTERGVNPAVGGPKGGIRARTPQPRAASTPHLRGVRRGPRRIYGRGHAGLGTYQEMADGSAQFLGPQNLTG